jgi:MYXO-CTERM domain-containing protein
MLRPTRTTFAALAIGASLAGAPCAFAGSTFLFNNSQTYSGVGSSPFAGTGGLIVENFEHGSINSLVNAVGGAVQGPSSHTDSVDAGGHSYATSGTSMTFTFGSSGGNRPIMAGLVWTDGQANAMVTFRAWDSSGNLLGKIRGRLGDLMRNGSTGEDRFFGVTSDQGISRIRITSSRPGFEIDHLQFAYGFNFSVVPLPPAFAMGLAGLAGAGFLRQIRRRKAA